MKHTTSLCFNKDGLINSGDLRMVEILPNVNTLILFGDGSEEALERINEFQDHPILSLSKIVKVGLGRTPQYELRVVNNDGSLSKPNYVYDAETKEKWLCYKIAAPHMEIFLSDFTSKSTTETRLTAKQTEYVCYLAHKLWTLLLAAEERLCFPAIAIDRMTRWTYSLTPETIDIVLLRKETGLSSLAYNPDTDLISLTVADDEFTVKLSILNDLYGSLILPFFNTIYGRRLRISVAIIGASGQITDPTDMSYGELGRIVEEMRVYTKERLIDIDHPLESEDLLAFAKKVKINDESCFWLEDKDTLVTALDRYRDPLLFRSQRDDSGDTDNFDDLPESSENPSPR